MQTEISYLTYLKRRSDGSKSDPLYSPVRDMPMRGELAAPASRSTKPLRRRTSGRSLAFA